MALGRKEEAIVSYARAIELRPNFAEAHAYRGAALHELSRCAEAIASFDRAIAIRPDYAEVHSNRGVALQQIGRLEEAVASYERAIELQPNLAVAHANRGVVLCKGRQIEAGAASLARALELNPEYPFLRGTFLHARMQGCDWKGLDGDRSALREKVATGAAAVEPLLALGMFDEPELHRRAADLWAGVTCPSDPQLGPIAPIAAAERIRIGYFSADFREHPVSYLLAGAFEEHDRSRFEITGFSFGPGKPDAMTERVAAAMDHFIDVRAQSDREVALLARERHIEIAIDLGGFTHSSRPGIFALRAAPIQASYLGYLGTMGAGWMDYLFADEVIVPPESRGYYSEKIACLPSYQANDRKRAISDRAMTREEFGLPPAGTVFCTFNATYKIAPATFDSWMRILQRVEGSVLFLLADNAQAAANLRREAVARGVAADRLVFAGLLPPAEYIARYRVADLFLDTLPYNAGTTASDALWAGLPVLTLVGRSFASRVAASLLTAIGLPELITTSPEDYERVAVELGTNTGKLGAVRKKLADNRLTTRLFDTTQFTRDIEAVYEAMCARYRAGLAPDHIVTRS